MQEFLVFTLYAPLQSWGCVSVGSERETWAFPSHSAIVGLIAAALGVRRSNTELCKLHSALRVAVRDDSAYKSIICDFHTIQAPRQESNKQWQTRFQEVASSNDVGTILSNREYLCDAAFTVVMWTVGLGLNVSDFVGPLKNPKFILYLGRKSCPLSLPLNPRIINGESAKNVLDSVAPPRQYLSWAVLESGQITDVCSDCCPMAGFEPREINFKRDILQDSHRWQFLERQEMIASVVIP